MSTTVIYRCARCGRRLKDGRWIYSRWTHKRYCYAGHCLKRRAKQGANDV